MCKCHQSGKKSSNANGDSIPFDFVPICKLLLGKSRNKHASVSNSFASKWHLTFHLHGISVTANHRMKLLLLFEFVIPLCLCFCDTIRSVCMFWSFCLCRFFACLFGSDSQWNFFVKYCHTNQHCMKICFRFAHFVQFPFGPDRVNSVQPTRTIVHCHRKKNSFTDLNKRLQHPGWILTVYWWEIFWRSFFHPIFFIWFFILHKKRGIFHSNWSRVSIRNV